MGSKVQEVPIKDTMLQEICPDIEAAFCFPQKYRTPNGECNNVKNPMWGVTGAAYLRLVAPQYEDGVGTPRVSGLSGEPLPDALTLSSRLLWSQDRPHEHLTALAAIWGQFVAHDISYTLPLSGYEQVRRSSVGRPLVNNVWEVLIGVIFLECRWVTRREVDTCFRE